MTIIGVLSDLAQVGPAPEKLSACRDSYSALRLALMYSSTNFDDTDLAEALGCSSSTLSYIVNFRPDTKERLEQEMRVRHIPDHWDRIVSEFTGNTILTDWRVLSATGKIKDQRFIRHGKIVHLPNVAPAINDD